MVWNIPIKPISAFCCCCLMSMSVKWEGSSSPQLKQSAEIIMHVETCVFSSKLYSSFSPTAAGWESSSVFWWLFCCFVGLGVLRFFCIRAKSSLDSSAGHRTKKQKASQLNGFECLQKLYWVILPVISDFCSGIKRWPYYVSKASVDNISSTNTFS